jgi:hypothetical protein
MKKIVFLLITLACFWALSEAASLRHKRFLFGSDEVEELPELDWNTVKFQEVNFNAKEENFGQNQLFEKVLECVKKCMQTINSDVDFRDKCIAKVCDIY